MEVEERTRAEKAVRFLADVSAVLAESLDYPTTLRSLARIVAPAFADWCIVDVVGEGGKIRRLTGVHADPAKERLLRELEERYPPDWGSPQPATHVLVSGKSLLLPELTSAILRAYGRDAENARLVRELGTRSIMAVPLIARGRTLGVITLGGSDPRHSFGSSDLELAEELARRAAIAIDNAHLYQEAQEGIRVREEFLSVAAHELKTPITSMNIGLQSVLRERERPSGERLMRVLQATEKQVRRLMRLVDDVLDVSQLQAGRLELHLERVDFPAVVAEVVKRFEERIAQSGSRVVIRAEAPVVGLWDRSRVDQVVANLLGNAIKFGEGKPIELSVVQRDGTAELSVEDHGIGISPERLPHIFERFERAVPTRHYGGLGLGLSIVWSITEALGGTVRVESTPGLGSKFTVVLPCSEATAETNSGGRRTMVDIPGYTLVSRLQSTSKSVLFHAVRDGDRLPVIVKTPMAVTRARASASATAGSSPSCSGSRTCAASPGPACELIHGRPVLLLEERRGRPCPSPWEAVRGAPGPGAGHLPGLDARGAPPPRRRPQGHQALQHHPPALGRDAAHRLRHRQPPARRARGRGCTRTSSKGRWRTCPRSRPGG